ncbi:MAG TPA: glycosyltransferase family 2 protein [Alloacidobacterium sp.]|jgi:glycosyltransferase involved in cell wall biosynthesis|nr:glycosyltransferase family 2 protein [Alloacidobacterium sp.]
MKQDSCLVSVVIPTHKRPQAVARAVESALAQSYSRLEVIVVIDGPEPETMRILRCFDDDRLRPIMLDEDVGGAEARNIGVRAAYGEWIAFLDDDDEWLPGKLKRQMEKAANIRVESPVLSSRLVERSDRTERVLPRRLYKTGENVAEYLFCRTGFAYGEGMLQTSTLLTKRKLLLNEPFQKGLQRHQDWDWLLKISERTDVQITMVPDVLTVMHVAKGADSVSRTGDWKFSLEWVKASRRRMSARAYSFFIATECVSRARRCGAGVGAMLRLFWECVGRGEPGLRQMVLFAGLCLAQNEVRRKFRRRCARDSAMTIGSYKQT